VAVRVIGASATAATLLERLTGETTEAVLREGLGGLARALVDCDALVSSYVSVRLAPGGPGRIVVLGLQPAPDSRDTTPSTGVLPPAKRVRLDIGTPVGGGWGRCPRGSQATHHPRTEQEH